ncbi:lysophospholipid acyltransferase family protein [Marinobacter sp. LN3S78]|uniref:lysophospholipid acyltransferase family protein n=1 Tax=Marinobacter sp. LN3S78 TaxID=3382300 RepID=UPI00387B1650
MAQQHQPTRTTPTRRQRLAMKLINLAGWRVPPFPDVDRAIVVGGPHTSNWDGVIGLTAAVALGLNAHFLIKHSAFKGPLGWLLRKLGGIPVDRSRAGGVVGQAIETLRQSDRLILVVAPEGTRSNARQWKTGFHHIARQAGVPIVVTVADYGTRELRFPLVLQPTDDLEADLEQLYQCFASVTPKHPDKLSDPVRERFQARHRQ